MTLEQMRNYIMEHPRYKNSPTWKAKCLKMPAPQVVAIYKQFQKVNYNKIAKEMKAQEKDNKNYHQMDMFEFMEGIK